MISDSREWNKPMKFDCPFSLLGRFYSLFTMMIHSLALSFQICSPHVTSHTAPTTRTLCVWERARVEKFGGFRDALRFEMSLRVIFSGLNIQLFYLLHCSAYDYFTTSGTAIATAGTTLGFFNDRGLPLIVVGNAATSATLSWVTPRTSAATTNLLPNYLVLTERTDLASLNFGVSLDYVCDPLF
jgi:hypothetical protein